MADTEIIPFEDRKIDSRFSDSPIPPRERTEYVYKIERKITAGCTLRKEEGCSGSHQSLANEESWEEHRPTPPITVPYSENKHSDGEDSYLGHSSLEEEYTRHRRPSISFNPQVVLDCGKHHALDEPLKNLRLNDEGPTESPCNGDSGESEGDQSDRSHEYRGGPLFPRGFSEQPSPGSETFSVDTELPRASSLTSLSTLSPITDELQTPPDGRRDVYLPNLTSPLCHAHSLDGTDSWLARNGLGKSQSFIARHNSHRLRHGSRRSTNSGGKSPASAFLSMFGRDTASEPQEDDEGQMVGTDYVLGKTIGYGGFSTVKEVFKVKDDGRTEGLAVKIVRKNLAGQSERENEQFQAEFDHEVRIWRYLNHYNILPLEAVYDTNFATFCITRLTNGGTLFELVKRHLRQGLKMDQAQHYAYQLASSIRYLHEDARIIHRDVKLENCLLQFDDSNDKEALGKLYLCDFGMSEWMNTDSAIHAPAPYNNAADRPPPRIIGPANMSTTIAGSNSGNGGSLEYAAPELIQSKEGILDPAVDIWAFGVIVFALLAGSRPFDHSFQPIVQKNIANGRWDRNAILKGDCDTEQRRDALQLIEGCLQVDPAKRWTIAEVLNCRWFEDCASKVEEHIQPNWSF